MLGIFGRNATAGWGFIQVFRRMLTHIFYNMDMYVLDNKFKEGWWTVWAATIWSIWLQRNDVIFNSGAIDVEKVMDLIIFRSWKWLKCKKKNFIYSS